MPAPRNFQKRIPKAYIPAVKVGRKRGSNRGSHGRWLFIWFALTGVAMVSATAGALLAMSINVNPLRQAELNPQEEEIFNRQGETISRSTLRLPELTRPVHILLMGTDKVEGGRSGDSFSGLSDTMLLLRFAPETSQVSVLSIPRDTRAQIPDHGINKVNSANILGGPALAAKTVSNLLEDVPIDRYVRVNLDGVEQLIDALGGVTIHVPNDMKYTDQTQGLYIDLKEGKQHLNGDQALQFLRFRYDSYGDIGRVQRQQMMMRALVDQALQPSIVVKIPKILSVIQSNLDTNLSVEELVALVGFSTQIDREQVQLLMLPGDFNGTGRDEVSYWLPNRSKTREMMAQHFDQGYVEMSESEPANQRIAIQYSRENTEELNKLVAKLRDGGYGNVYVDHNWGKSVEVTRVVAQGGSERSAREVQALIGLGEVRVESTGVLQSDVTIQIGRDWRL